MIDYLKRFLIDKVDTVARINITECRNTWPNVGNVCRKKSVLVLGFNHRLNLSIENLEFIIMSVTKKLALDNRCKSIDNLIVISTPNLYTIVRPWWNMSDDLYLRSVVKINGEEKLIEIE